ncbi:hypothetical protein YC2023_061932 [Brassica napus]
MDPSNLPSQSSSYVGLLHSQQGSVYHENFPYGSFHSSVNFGESDTFPAFSSQQPEDAPVDAPVDAQAARPLVAFQRGRMCRQIPKLLPTKASLMLRACPKVSRLLRLKEIRVKGSPWLRLQQFGK